jgi:hypothetical protein
MRDEAGNYILWFTSSGTQLAAFMAHPIPSHPLSGN